MDFGALQTRTYEKGDIILHKGDLCRFSYFVVSGCLKSYVIDSTGKEHILLKTTQALINPILKNF